MIFLLISEVFFFFRFFWGFFHNCWLPQPELGKEWPPLGFCNIMVDSFSIPLLNTVILLSSGVSVTWAHHMLLRNNFLSFFFGLLITVVLGILFLGFQRFEYISSSFRFKRKIFGSCFYLLTGFHGGHVIIGTIFLIICLFRGVLKRLIPFHHVGLELAIWYWHFVDVVWLFLFVFVYWYNQLSLI